MPTSGQLTADGLWARLRRGTTRVVLALVDGVTGVIWPPAVVDGEADARPWATLFRRARDAGLDVQRARGWTCSGRGA